jgi:pimeloyl-ACP methyl ester carboxylesterase
MVVQLVFGIGLLTTSAPIFISYADKRGPGIEATAAGSVLLVAIAATVVATTRLVATTKAGWRRWLALPMALVVAQFVVLPMGMAVYATNAASPLLGTRTPADLGMTYEDVTITSADGTKLAAWYVESRNGAAVLLRHGSGSTRTSTLDHAEFLADAGYGVLLTDARGHGASDGRINELGWHGPEDIEAAIDYLSERPDVTVGIGILGLSMGGEEAINAAASDERIEAVVAEGAGTSTYPDSVAAGANVVARIVNWTQFAMVDVLSDAAQPFGVASSMMELAPRPVLLITGEEAIEKTMGPIYARAGGLTSTLWELPGTPHQAGLSEHRAAYVGRVTRFFGATLRAK